MDNIYIGYHCDKVYKKYKIIIPCCKISCIDCIIGSYYSNNYFIKKTTYI